MRRPDVMRRLWDAQPATSELALRCIAFTRECQREEVAAQIAAAALAQWPDEVRLLAQAGELAPERGDFETARAQLSARRFLRDPARRDLTALAHSHRYRRDEPGDAADIAALRAARSQRGEGRPDLPVFRPGRVLDDRGERAEAVALWREGNARARRQQTWSSVAGSASSRSRWRRRRYPRSTPQPTGVRCSWSACRAPARPVASLLCARCRRRFARRELNWLAAWPLASTASRPRCASASAAALFAAQLRYRTTRRRDLPRQEPAQLPPPGLALALLAGAGRALCATCATRACRSGASIRPSRSGLELRFRRHRRLTPPASVP